MIEFLDTIDKRLLLTINSIHFDWLDPIMKFISSNWFWIPIVALFVSLIICSRRRFWPQLIFVCLCFVTTELVSHFTKENVNRLRPTHNTEIRDRVHIVDNYRGGKYSFFSGHAANSFGLALITLLLIRRKFYTAIVVPWAIIVTYSRLYLGVHYPFDILCGMIFGIISALGFYFLWKKAAFWCN